MLGGPKRFRRRSTGLPCHDENEFSRPERNGLDREASPTPPRRAILTNAKPSAGGFNPSRGSKDELTAYSRSRHSNPRLWPRADHLLDHQGPNQPRINGASQQGLERYALTKSPPLRNLARRIGSVRNFGQRSFREAFVCELRRGVTSRLSFLLRVNVDILLAGSTAAVCAAPSFVATGPSLGDSSVRQSGAMRHSTAAGGNGINLSMLSRARDESSPRPCAIKNLRKGSQETRMQDIPAETKKRGPSSRVLQEVIRQAPAGYVTVGWLTSTLHRHSFGIIMLCLGLLATTPVGSTVPGLILAIMAVQVIVGRAEPAFPHFIMTRRLPTKQLLRLGGRAIHVLKYLEKVVHPRWPMTFEVAKHAVGVMVLLLTVVLLLTPVPLSNVAPAMVISLISLAYVEEDGLVLSVGFLAAIILIGLGSAAVWGTIIGAVLINA